MLRVIDRTLRQSQNAVSDVHPSIGRVSRVPVRWYARSWILAGRLIGSLRHDAPIDPMRIHYVDPGRIGGSVSWLRVSSDRKSDEHPRFRPPKYRLAGRVFDGGWDSVEYTFTDSTIYRSFSRHFDDGVPWEETEFYVETLDAIQQGASPWGCMSECDLDRRCGYIDRLYERIDSRGYKTQDELHAAGDPSISPHRMYRVIWGEIAVNVGRNGELIFQDGRNRLAIAKLLDLEEIPVVILVRHAQWQRLRDRISRRELGADALAEELRSHPDLEDLFSRPDVQG